MTRAGIDMPVGQILVGDVRQRLAELPDASVDTVITSPPYFALRDYGVKDQLGLEPTVDDWVDGLVGVCQELERVLKPGGSLWLNVGDGYSNHPNQGAEKKSLVLGPQRLAIALIHDGWVIRNQVVWAKTNPMPSSVGDRLSCTYEVLLLCVRTRHYYFDLDAIRRPLMSHAAKRPGAIHYQYLPDEARPDRAGVDDDRGLGRLKAEGRAGHPLGGNPGDVWQLATASYRGAHFATYPMTLIEKPLLSTCPERVCSRCGEAWTRQPVDRQQAVPILGELVPQCACVAEPRPGIVLDPFLGSGTTAVVAELHGRDWIGIELNPKYAALARRRLAQWRRTS